MVLPTFFLIHEQNKLGGINIKQKNKIITETKTNWALTFRVYAFRQYQMWWSKKKKKLRKISRTMISKDHKLFLRRKHKKKVFEKKKIFFFSFRSRNMSVWAVSAIKICQKKFLFIYVCDLIFGRGTFSLAEMIRFSLNITMMRENFEEYFAEVFAWLNLYPEHSYSRLCNLFLDAGITSRFCIRAVIGLEVYNFLASAPTPPHRLEMHASYLKTALFSMFMS